MSGIDAKWISATQAALILEAYREAEIARLTEKARLMDCGEYDAPHAESDRIWRAQNERMINQADALMLDSLEW